MVDVRPAGLAASCERELDVLQVDPCLDHESYETGRGILVPAGMRDRRDVRLSHPK